MMTKQLNISEYKSYNGFYDLKEFDLPAIIFKKFWKIQDFLFYVKSKKDYYKKYLPNQWQEVKELSASYQQELFTYSKKADVK
jgi:hypothetical protein